MEGADASSGGSGEKKKALQEGGGEKLAKRKMKTAYQLELLEKTYAVASYPSEALRVELSAKIGLSDRQLQMWFCHQRLKDKKASEMAVAGTTSGSGPGPSSQHEPRKALARMSTVAAPRVGTEGVVPVVRSRYYEPILVQQPTVSEMQALAFVESQLGESIREDEPILGMEFDPLLAIPMTLQESKHRWHDL